MKTVTQTMPNVKCPRKGYWYYTITEECVGCGASETWKERQWHKAKPEPHERYAFIQTLCPMCAFG